MLQPDEVTAMVRLHELGWGAKRLSKEFGCARNTVRRYLRAGGVVPFAKAPRKSAFDGLDDWLRERFFRHNGNADVIRQELASEHGIVIGLRSVELRVQPWRRELRAHKKATVRFETRPGHQLQIDFGDTKVRIGEERIKIHLFVATLGYSRRMHIRPSLRERQTDWFEGMEGTFLRFGGVPTEVLFDNARALVDHHDAATREVRFNARLHAFARYWGFNPRACAPYRARTKGKDERGVGYVKRNAIAGRRFASWAPFLPTSINGTGRLPTCAFTAPLVNCQSCALPMRRMPCVRSADAHRSASCATWPARCALTARSTSIPTATRSRGVSSARRSRSVVLGGRVIVRHAGEVVADHAQCEGRRQRVIERTHLAGLVGAAPARATMPPVAPPALLRPLAEYEAVVGGAW